MRNIHQKFKTVGDYQRSLRVQIHNLKKELLYSVSIFENLKEFHSIVSEILEIFKVTPTQLKSKNRSQNIVNARTVICALTYKKRDKYFSGKEIANLLGYADHASVIIAKKNCLRFFKYDVVFRETLKSNPKIFDLINNQLTNNDK